MKILFICHYFWPEDVGTCIQSTELVEDFAKAGHIITVLTTFPHYPKGQIFKGYRNKLLQREYRNKYFINRSFVYITKSKVLWKRILNYGSFAFSALYSGLFIKYIPDIIYVDMPPLPLGLTAYLLSRFYGAKLALTIHDIEPERAVKLGLFKNKRLINFLEKLEKFIYRKADKIAVVGEALKKNLVSKGVSAQKIKVIPTWSDPNRIKPLPKFNDFRKRYASEIDFLIVYSGNIGYTSALEPLIKVACRLNNETRVKFLIVGDGVKKSILKNMVSKSNINNVKFLPFQPFNMLSKILSSADLGVVTLDENMSAFSVPGKTYSIMASERPIIGLVSSDNDVMDIVTEAKCGVCIQPHDTEGIINIILRYKNNDKELEKMGKNGRKYLVKHLSRQVCVKQHESLLKEIV